MTQAVRTAAAPAGSPSPPPPRETGRRRPHVTTVLPRWPIAIAALLLTVLVVYPVVLLLGQSIFPEILSGRLDNALSPYGRLATVDGILSMLRTSLLFGVLTTLFAWGLGVPSGWLLARTDLRGGRAARLICLVPIMTPPYVYALAFLIVMMPSGLADRVSGGMPALLRDGFFSIVGVALVMAVSSFGYVALAVETHLRAQSTRLEDAAAMLGAGPLRRFRCVTLPLLRPALLNSGLLVLLDAISNFGVPVILGPRAGLPLLPAEIHALVTSWPVDFPLATALSSLLMVTATAALLFNRRLLRERGAAGGRTALVRRTPLSRRGLAGAWTWFTSVALLAIVVPGGAMLTTSLVEVWREGMPTFGIAHYVSILAPESSGRRALGTSLGLGAAAATVSVLLGGCTAWMLHRQCGPVARALDVVATLPRVLPKIVVAVALIIAWNAPWIPVAVYGSVWMLLVAYIALYLSDALRLSDAGMRSISIRLEHAALVHGAGPGRTARSITLPLLRSALIAGWMTTFIACVRDLVASVMLLPPGAETVGSFIHAQFEQGEIAVAMAMATLVTVLTTVILSALPGARR